MTVSTTRFFDNNSALFKELNDELKSLQGQAATGENELTLANNLIDISKLSAATEKKSETNQFLNNAKRAQSDLELLDVAFERLQNLLINLQEIAVESASDILLPEERQRFIQEVQMVKSEIVNIANQKDTFGNNLFGGVSGVEKSYEIKPSGEINYLGSSLAKEIQITPGLAVKQNFSGLDVFDTVKNNDGTFSVFEVVDDLINSLEIDLNSNVSSNLFRGGTQSVVIQIPSTGPEARLAMSFHVDASQIDIDEIFYGNDFSKLVDAVNGQTASTGLSASFLGDNQILLQGEVDTLKLDNFYHFGNHSVQHEINILSEKDGDILESISKRTLQSSNITQRVTDAFEHFATKRAEVNASARRAQESEISMQDILITLEEDISEIKDADLASILTQLEFLMTQKDAAQATFTRITSKSLFDFLG